MEFLNLFVSVSVSPGRKLQYGKSKPLFA